jgi:hypothetical protein
MDITKKMRELCGGKYGGIIVGLLHWQQLLGTISPLSLSLIALSADLRSCSASALRISTSSGK